MRSQRTGTSSGYGFPLRLEQLERAWLLPDEHSACEERGVSWRMALPSACHSAGEGMGERHVGSESEVVNSAKR